ncbi:MAG TPA: radical SAM protein [Anaerolineae bacterium]|nr:radical SAM protein [Anaerolineae bacterium]
MPALSPHTVIRPEPGGALLFQQETAETALLDLEGLDALYFLLKGELRDYPPFFIAYLRQHRFVAEGSVDGSLERVAAVRDAAPTMTAPPRALAAPETIHFSVTGRCDQACAGCFYSARPGSAVRPSDAPFELFQRVVRQAAKARVFQMALGGGEPLLHPRLLEMVRLARRSGIVPNLTTNGNLLTVEMAVALREAGLGQVQISLNGASEGTNRATRPNFAQALAAMEGCRAAGLRFGINFLLTRTVLPDLEQVFRLGEFLGAATVNLLRPKPPTTDGDWLERESPTAADYRRVRRILRRLQPRWRAGGSEQPATRITIDASLTFLLTDRSPQSLYRAGVWGCSAARKFVTVTQEGEILPCSHVRWSDMGGGDVMRAWWESTVLARFRALEEEMRGLCRACRYLDLCRGCPAVVMAFGGAFGDSDPHCPTTAAKK